MIRFVRQYARYAWLIAAGLALAGCAAYSAVSGTWSQAGETQEAADSVMQECKTASAAALRAEANIDADIDNARGSGGRLGGGGRANVEQRRETHEGKRDRHIARCMIMRGYLIEE